MNTIFDIEQKQDSPEKLAAVANKETKYILFANEFNDVARKAVESAIDNFSVDFTWSQKPGHVLHKVNGINDVQLLTVKFYEDWFFNEVDKVELLIDRYRPKRIIRKYLQRFKPSGFKHEIMIGNPSPEKARVSSVVLSGRETLVNFGQAFYFRAPNNINEAPIVKGFGQKNREYNRAWVYLRFRLRITKGQKVYYSKPKGIIEMSVQLVPIENQIKRKLSYKLV